MMIQVLQADGYQHAYSVSVRETRKVACRLSSVLEKRKQGVNTWWNDDCLSDDTVNDLKKQHGAGNVRRVRNTTTFQKLETPLNYFVLFSLSK